MAARPMFNLEKRGTDWCVVGKSGTLVYCSSFYAKAVGVHEYMLARAEAAASERNARAPNNHNGEQ